MGSSPYKFKKYTKFNGSLGSGGQTLTDNSKRHGGRLPESR
jgi:hypothetical protein